MTTDNITRPLEGIRVIGLEQYMAGPYCTMLLADAGAEVIKIEVPGSGDGSRRAGAIKKGLSSFFETNNRGVKSLTLNLKAAEGKQILHELIKRADIFGQNFRPGAAERNGFGYEELKKINPRLVYASVSAYGLEGPDADLPGTDAVGQALSGVTEAFSVPGQPMRTGVASVADETTAILTFGGVLAALIHAKETGQGQKVDTSLVGSAFRLMGWTMATFKVRPSILPFPRLPLKKTTDTTISEYIALLDHVRRSFTDSRVKKSGSKSSIFMLFGRFLRDSPPV